MPVYDRLSLGKHFSRTPPAVILHQADGGIPMPAARPSDLGLFLQRRRSGIDIPHNDRSTIDRRRHAVTAPRLNVSLALPRCALEGDPACAVAT
ncbi:hypothetical protein Herbaro_15790 [Herbaspirillum sp. WKF16]|uniref:hypothetical protein n=1 Tax=Herbaspirillum sp. WKF16 TaxID=3028312 RepID=UPI0023A9CDB8|nr:hypothetical protein [Herbaspirillum sp. WKF16]WDZ94938.1 hypothetical protein Herbaro_15790 [Herbaspirillum sp. WKF16]